MAQPSNRPSRPTPPTCTDPQRAVGERPGAVRRGGTAGAGVWGAWTAAAIGLFAVGCVHVYQPMSGLHDPVVVDPTAENFSDVRLTVVCLPGGLLNLQEASALCRRVGLLFENQGAKVTTSVGGSREDLGEDTGTSEELPGEVASARPDRTNELTLELRAREVHQANHPLSWALNLTTFTLVPAINERTFEQDVVVRDASGVLLARDTMQGRVVRYFGGGVWLGNKLLDLTVRPDEDEITGDVAKEQLSDDLYRQLSQAVFNAKMQQRVLDHAHPTAAAAAAPGN